MYDCNSNGMMSKLHQNTNNVNRKSYISKTDRRMFLLSVILLLGGVRPLRYL